MIRVITALFALAVGASSVNAYGYGRRPGPQRPPNPPNYPDYDYNDYETFQPVNTAGNPSNAGVSVKFVMQPAEDFSYTKHGGQENWQNIYPTCGGSHQSPINLAHTHSKALAPLYFHMYWDNTNKANIKNTGHVAEVKFTGNGKLPYLTGGPLKDEYEFVGLHFHWGSHDFDGSEHVIGGKQFSMEAHVVHYKKSYGTSQEAMKHPDGLAVVAFLLQVSGNHLNKDFQPVVQNLAKIKKAESETEIAPFSAFHWFKDRTHDNFFTYRGSLTTPPCSEVVTWIVYQKPIAISSSQAAEFRTLRGADNKIINTNHRDTQNYRHPDISFVHGFP